ncbi:E3 ubiquitin-protein ligase RMA1H1-like [Amaranthus tricolor]|uniref:E3 ubiquitin-protein ligase RMA1H1-like n=1 Tax=Amaranthus tricolor TaxID=29722 RepID=UPI00258C889D|nr:E3 ubiquitin-protein ligase RMA1H1-like [Amaranthus tricolor]XP_057525701.1 E3 ubiquitin-protein ligase RMA1H1-like [Amaranthus tricolor]
MEFFEHSVKQSKSSEADMEKLKSSSSSGDAGMENNSSAGFDCNICLDLVREPVITFCGHLYCWPCIYRWMHQPDSSFDRQPQCPVCKAEVSRNTLIPLYGRGQSGKQSDHTGSIPKLSVPNRPSSPGCGVHTLITATSTSSHPNQLLNYGGYPHHNQVHPHYSLDEYSQSPTFAFAGTTTYNPMINIFGEMIYARNFGNQQTTIYDCPNTYSVVTMNSPRLRRHLMQVDRSLSRVSFFLLCGIIFCLLLF